MRKAQAARYSWAMILRLHFIGRASALADRIVTPTAADFAIGDRLVLPSKGDHVMLRRRDGVDPEWFVCKGLRFDLTAPDGNTVYLMLESA
jgi:hypothetical protein